MFGHSIGLAGQVEVADPGAVQYFECAQGMKTVTRLRSRHIEAAGSVERARAYGIPSLGVARLTRVKECDCGASANDKGD